MVTGNAGSGKTTFAHELGRALGTPVTSLDEIVWQAGWRKTPVHEKRAALRDVVRRSAWIVEGVSDSVEDVADLVVFLDVTPSVCTWRCLKRSRRFLFRSRPGLPPQCHEWRIFPRLLKIVWRFDKHVRPGIVERMQQRPQHYLHVLTEHDRDHMLHELAGLLYKDPGLGRH